MTWERQPTERPSCQWRHGTPSASPAARDLPGLVRGRARHAHTRTLAKGTHPVGSGGGAVWSIPRASRAPAGSADHSPSASPRRVATCVTCRGTRCRAAPSPSRGENPRKSLARICVQLLGERHALVQDLPSDSSRRIRPVRWRLRDGQIAVSRSPGRSRGRRGGRKWGRTDGPFSTPGAGLRGKP